MAGINDNIYKANDEYCADTIYNFRNLGFYQELGIINQTGEKIYVCNIYKQVYEVQTNIVGMSNYKSLRIMLRTESNARARYFNNYGIESPIDNKGFKLKAFEINVRYLNEVGHIYIAELGLCIAYTKHEALAHHQAMPEFFEQRYKSLNEIYKNAICLAPFKIMANDPHFRINKIWTILNNRVFCISIANESNEPPMCKVYFGVDPGDYRVFDFDIEDVIKGKGIFDCGNTSLVMFTTKEQAVQHLMKTKSTDCIYTRKDLKERMTETHELYKNEIDNLKRLLEKEKQANDIIRDENISLRSQLLQKENMEFNKIKLEREDIKLDKERSKAKLDNWTTMIKAISIILPTTLSLLSIFLNMKNNNKNKLI